jgi:hypothetical protein
MGKQIKNRLTILSGGSFLQSAPREIRTPVLGLKGPRPSPLDDGGELDENSIIGPLSGQALAHLFRPLTDSAHIMDGHFKFIHYN